MAEKRSWTEAQEQAMNLRGKLLLVSAAAGSGKTSVLTERIIRTLTQEKDPADLSRMLVVTFTRAATAELKSRIADALTRALAERPGDPHLSKQLFLLGSARISTIDAFFQQAVRANFEQLGLPASFRLADETEGDTLALSVMNDAIHDMYDRYTPEKADPNGSPFAPLENNAFARAMNHLMSNRNDSKFDMKLLQFERKFHAHPRGISLLREYSNTFRVATKQEFFLSPMGASLRRYLSNTVKDLLQALKPTANYLAADPDANEKYSGIFNYDLDYCTALINALDNCSYESTRKAALSYLPAKFPGYRNKPLPILEYKSVRDRIKELAAELKESLLSVSVEELSYQLTETAHLCDMLHELFHDYNTRLWDEKKQRGVLEFDDVRSQLHKLLETENGEPTPFANELAQQFDTVYIDEYQDVDSLQDRIFALIGGQNRFMVGDIKQSIYGFRGSEPSIFTAYRNAMPQHDQPEAAASDAVCVFMSENFRCNEPVIRFANRVCSFLFSACEETVGYRPKDDLVFSKGRDGQLPPAPPVQTVVFEAPPRKRYSEEDDEEEGSEDSREALWVAAEISRLIREEKLDDGSPIRPSSIAILVRNAKHGEPFARALEGIGIRASAPGSEQVLRSPLVTDTLNLLRAIDNPHRDLPLLEYLISPIGGFSLEELSEIRDAAPEIKTLYDALVSVSETPGHPLFDKALRQIRWLEGQRAAAASQTADRFLRLLYLDPILAPYATTPELLALYEQARSYQKNAWNGLFGFLEQIDRLLNGKPISADGFRKAEEAVSIMTIHHSKGLEYPVVFVCACDKRPSDQSLKDSLIYHPRVGCTGKLFDGASGANRTTLLREIAKLEVRADEAEEGIRILYVALTRARERLYVTGTPRGSIEKTLESASQVCRGSRENILYHPNYLRWILAALQEKASENTEFPCIFRKILLSAPIEPIPIAGVTEPKEMAEKGDGAESVAGFYRGIAQRQRSFVYPLDALRGIPTKVAASKLYSGLLDTVLSEEEDPDALSRQIELMSSPPSPFEVLLGDRQKPSATDIGTATHSFLQYCDLKRLPEVGIDTEIQRLTEQKFITLETAEILNRDWLNAFLNSNLMEWILHAKKIYREQKFNLFVPLSALSETKKNDALYQSNTVFVQGSIDLILQMKDGNLLLFDYKTDHISEAEVANEPLLIHRMEKKHADQLSCYAGAVQRMFGKAPHGTYLYSLPLGKAIPLSADPHRFE